MIPVNWLNTFSDSTLISIYKTLNFWEWPEILGEKPEGWDDMPSYKKPWTGECKTKEDIIRPYMKEIRKRIPYEVIYSGTRQT